MNFLLPSTKEGLPKYGAKSKSPEIKDWQMRAHKIKNFHMSRVWGETQWENCKTNNKLRKNLGQESQR